MDFDLKDIKWALLNSYEYSLFSEEEKKVLKENFDKKWDGFLKNLIK